MLRSLAAVSLLLAATLAVGAQPAPSPEVLKDLAPTGKLRAAINFGNAVLAQKGPGGEPKGITPDLATALAKRLNVPVEFVPYEAAGKVFEGAKAAIARINIDGEPPQDTCDRITMNKDVLDLQVVKL